MTGTPAGAPLRAVGTFAAMWIVLRLSISNFPEDPGPAAPGPLVAVSAENIAGQNVSAISEGRSILSALVPSPAYHHPGEARRDSGSLAGSNDFIPHFSEPWPYLSTDFSLAMKQRAMVGPVGSPISTARRYRRISSRPELSGPFHTGASPGARSSRLSGYFWLFSRQDSGRIDPQESASGTIISNGQYGGSQAGAIISYPLWERRGAELSVYSRLTTALASTDQIEWAAGSRVKPFRNLPLAAHLEQRLDVDSGGNGGTALYLAGGTGPDPVFERLTLETYGQAGYIVGSNETHFFDGSVLIQNPVVEFSRISISTGAGLWSGGQRGSARLDVGPRIDVRISADTGSARISADWRERIAGNARPAGGPSITVSTGF